METLISELTKKPFKNWKNVFQVFLTESVIEHAKNNEDGLSFFLLGLCHEQGLFVQKDYDIALEFFRQGANKRDALCLYKLYEIYSGKTLYGIEPDREVAFLYLVWAVTYMFAIYGSYMCLDFDLELQFYYKNTLKQNKEEVFRIIEDYDDDIFAYDKDLIKCVFGFLIEFISPSNPGNVQERYQEMMETLVQIAEKGDPRLPIMFLFKCTLWDFKGVTARDHKKVMNLIRKKNCVSFIHQHLMSVYAYIKLVNKKHTIFSRLLHFHGTEVYFQIKHNCNSSDIRNKKQACSELANFLYNHIHLMDSNNTRAMVIFIMAKSFKNTDEDDKELNQAISVLECSREMQGFLDQDYPYLLAGKLYSKTEKQEKSKTCYDKYLLYTHVKPDLPIKFYEEGQYMEDYKKDKVKAIDAYVKGLYSPVELNTFIQEIYTRKCRSKITKLINRSNELHTTYYPSLEKARFFHDDDGQEDLCGEC